MLSKGTQCIAEIRSDGLSECEVYSGWIAEHTREDPLANAWQEFWQEIRYESAHRD